MAAIRSGALEHERVLWPRRRVFEDAGHPGTIRGAREVFRRQNLPRDSRLTLLFFVPRQGVSRAGAATRRIQARKESPHV